MFEDGMSLKAFQMVLRWLYTGSHEYIESNDSGQVMELIAMANLLGLESLVRVCELKLSKMLTEYLVSARKCFDFAER